MTPSANPHQVTQLLARIESGHPSTADELLPLVYDELRVLAAHFFRTQRPDHTLQPTALVHAAYAKMIAHEGDTPSRDRWNSRAHFFAVAAKAMRQVLANHARDRRASKRGGAEWHRITLDQALTPSGERDLNLLALDEALEKLTELDARQSRIVELRFFAEMTVDEIAHVLGTSPSTVEREWRMARAWLSGQLRRGDRE